MHWCLAAMHLVVLGTYYRIVAGKQKSSKLLLSEFIVGDSSKYNSQQQSRKYQGIN